MVYKVTQHCQIRTDTKTLLLGRVKIEKDSSNVVQF